MDELEAENEAVLEAAVAHLREVAQKYGLPFDDRTHALAKQKLAQQGFASRAEVVQFYEDSPLVLTEIVQATCAQHTDKIIADLGHHAATSRELQQPSRHRHEAPHVYAARIDTQLRAGGGGSAAADFAPVPAPQMPGETDSLETQRAKHKDALMGQDAEYFAPADVVTEITFTAEASDRTVCMLQDALGGAAAAAKYATMTAQHMAECEAPDPTDLSRHATKLLANKLALAMPHLSGDARENVERLNAELMAAIRRLPVLGAQAPAPPA